MTLYGVKPRDPLLAIIRKNEFREGTAFLKKRRQIRLNVADAARLAQIKMSVQFDAKHRPSDLKENVYLKLAKTGKIGYHVPKQSFFTVKKLGPFFIKKKISNLIYELKLSQSMKIHFVISVIHLEQILNDEFERELISHTAGSDSIVIDEKNHYVVEKIIKTETRKSKLEFMMK